MKTFFISLLLTLPATGLTALAAEKTQEPKKVSILGDSYSTFEGAVQPASNALWYFKKVDPNRTDVDDVSQTWWSIFASENGYAVERNNAYSGATVSSSGYRNEDYSDRSFVSRMYNLGNPDLILILGATNDSWAGAPVGEWKWENQTAGDLKYFRPSMAYMLANMKKLYPEAEIVFILNDDLRDDIDEAVIETCRRYGVRYLELQGIKKKTGHPDKEGMRQIADQLTDFMKKK